MWLTTFPRCELRPKQLATSWDCSSSIIWEYYRRDVNTTRKWPSLSLTFFISWTSAGFSCTAEIPIQACYDLLLGRLWRSSTARWQYKANIYLAFAETRWNNAGAFSGSIDFLLTASPNFFCGRFSITSMLNIVVVSILKRSRNCKPS